jgi:hypothetical protein
VLYFGGMLESICLNMANSINFSHNLVTLGHLFSIKTFVYVVFGFFFFCVCVCDEDVKICQKYKHCL